MKAAITNNGEGWEPVFSPTDFVVAHPKYLAVEIYVQDLPEHDFEKQFQSWTGYVESRLRKLVENLTNSYSLVEHLRLMPKKLPLLTEAAKGCAQNGKGQAFLIGFGVDKYNLRGTELDLTRQVEQFKDHFVYNGAYNNNILNESEGRTQANMRLRISCFQAWQEMPDVVFETLGGREAATSAYRVIRKARRETARKEAAEREQAAAEQAAFDAQELASREYGDDNETPAYATTDEYLESTTVPACKEHDADTAAGRANGAIKRGAMEPEAVAMRPTKAARAELMKGVETQELVDAQDGQAAGGGSSSKITLTLL